MWDYFHLWIDPHSVLSEDVLQQTVYEETSVSLMWPQLRWLTLTERQSKINNETTDQSCLSKQLCPALLYTDLSV